MTRHEMLWGGLLPVGYPGIGGSEPLCGGGNMVTSKFSGSAASHREYLAMSEDIFGEYKWYPVGKRSGMTATMLQRPGVQECQVPEAGEPAPARRTPSVNHVSGGLHPYAAV